MGINILTDVPAFEWSYGCSATSAAMMAGYYDRNGYSNMYAGPGGTPAGLCPLDNSEWGAGIGGSDGECPLSATHLGKDGLAVRGHVDDYWVSYASAADDPWIGNWAEHTYADCTGDFMKTNQSSYENTDGETHFIFYTDGSPIYYADLDAILYGLGTYADYDGGCGLQDFFESRGYTVTTMYNQYIYGYDGNTQGFTFDDFKDEIDAGRPVLIHIVGHTMLGYGYSDAGETIYIHDTWDYNAHTMTWGGSYYGSPQVGVTAIGLDPVPASRGLVWLDSNFYPVPAIVNITVWDSDLAGNGTVDVTVESDPTGDSEGITLTETGASTGIFEGSAGLVLSDAGEDELLVDYGDTVIVTYVDADDGEGGTDVDVTDTATVVRIIAPTGFTATAWMNSVILRWNRITVSACAGYNVYRSASLAGTKTKLNGSLISPNTNNSYMDSELSYDTTYYYWVTAVDTYGMETDYSAYRSVTITEGGDIDDGDGGGGGSGGSGVGSLSGCFIATACYGTPMAKEVKILSDFRDNYLMTNSLGRIFVGTYYKFSPQIAEYISERPALKKFVRIALKPLVDFSEKLIGK
jgi:hypothetical protein